MRTLTLEHSYTIDRATLVSRLSDGRTWEALGSAAEVNRVDSDNVVTVRTRVDATDLPGALASRLPSGAELVETYVIPADLEEDPTEVRMTARAQGVPVEIDALITLAEAPTGSDMSVRVEISSSIPLFGSMIEEAIVPMLRSRMEERLLAFV